MLLGEGIGYGDTEAKWRQQQVADQGLKRSFNDLDLARERMAQQQQQQQRVEVKFEDKIEEKQVEVKSAEVESDDDDDDDEEEVEVVKVDKGKQKIIDLTESGDFDTTMVVDGKARRGTKRTLFVVDITDDGDDEIHECDPVSLKRIKKL